MNLSVRNRKVAVNRWEKILRKEAADLRKDKAAIADKIAICGFLAGDGSVQIRKEKTFLHYQIDFFPDDVTMLETYATLMNRVYHKKPSIRQRDNVFHLRNTSKIIVLDLLNYTKFGIRKWEIPRLALQDDDLGKVWLKAFFSSDGYVGANTVRIQTVNKYGMLQLSELLEHYKIRHHCYEYQSAQEKISRVFIVAINRKEDRLRFFNEIGFWHAKKELCLRKSLNL